ncbi:phosphodiester glycosidase family protein [Cognatishimia sp. F0-27]|uniref:phosphodiester glycosidase family protein n=1 Tax=Cognatishimia sp. F0-27 TaxID=2816855 RepID=UPI001D0C90BE|nr:phosphodiester glycosidase family protein [Cognatishimia sp. F0-27]MCC1492211.1 phosphodiester glycosidase family protein [Cognatishimia sp. F0-27]
MIERARLLLGFGLAVAISALGPAPAQAVTCNTIDFEENRFTLCEVTLPQETLRLYRTDPLGVPYGHFSELATRVEALGETLVFAMNGGMYHDDRAPVGHYVEDGVEQMRVIATPGPGNFGLLPNGVFCIREGRADVIETGLYLESDPGCTYATQSGPMLVIDGELHPRFLPDSTSRYVRNGVGTSEDGQRVVFAISENAVTFHEFGRLFRDQIGVPNALFLDGNVSRLYAPEIGRSDLGRRMGPIIAVTEPAR